MQSDTINKKLVTKPENWQDPSLNGHFRNPEAAITEGNAKMATVKSATARDKT